MEAIFFSETKQNSIDFKLYRKMVKWIMLSRLKRRILSWIHNNMQFHMKIQQKKNVKFFIKTAFFVTNEKKGINKICMKISTSESCSVESVCMWNMSTYDKLSERSSNNPTESRTCFLADWLLCCICVSLEKNKILHSAPCPSCSAEVTHTCTYTVHYMHSTRTHSQHTHTHKHSLTSAHNREFDKLKAFNRCNELERTMHE